MIKAAIPDNEQNRLKALMAYRILDTEAEKAFDDLTRLAAHICQSPIALISLVDPERQWFKSKVGLDACQTDRDIAFCAHAIHQDNIFEIPDAHQDPRFHDNPLVTGEPYIRFYAGTPLITPEGYAIGTLCVMGSEPGQLSTEQRSALETLGREVISQLELRKKVRELNQANQFKTEFLSNMSHEVRTPINGITGALHLLQDSGLSPSQQHLADLALNSATSLSEIVNDILDLSRIEAGKLELQPATFDLQELITELGATYNIRTGEKHLEFICPTTQVPDITLRADQLRLRQILNNLVSNAIKFTHEGSVQVGVSLTEDPEKADYVRARFEVTDTGVGLTEEQAENLFDRYQQAHLTASYGGSGLGLSICQQLTQLMQGKIGVSSEAGQGSCFWFEVSLQKTAGSIDLPHKDLSHLRILALHSGPAQRRFLSRLLHQQGLEYKVCDPEALPEILADTAYGKAFTHLLIEDRLEYRSSHLLSQQLTANQPQMRHCRTILLHTPTFRHAELDFSRYKAVICQPLLPNELIHCLSYAGDTGSEKTFQAPKPAQQRFSGHALIAEDNQTNQIVARGLLQKMGLSTQVANDGFEALHMLRETTFDIVFMDCRMPVMDGFEATRRLRAEPQMQTPAQVPVVALTASAMRDDKQLCLDAGMDAFLSKPINPKKLTQVLARYLPEEHHSPEADSQASPTADDSTPAFEIASFRERLGDDPELMQLTLEAALADFDELFSMLQNASADQRPALLHQLKGLAANCSAQELYTNLQALEKSDNAQAVPFTEQALPQLKEQLQRFRTSVHQLLA